MNFDAEIDHPKRLRVVFFGCTNLSFECCRVIISENLADVVGIVTIPYEFRISYSEQRVRNVQYADMRALASLKGIFVQEVEECGESIHRTLTALKPDLLVVIGWYYKIPRVIRELAPKGCVGIHASLLPKYRGGAPLVWAVINGETQSGVTLFHFTDNMDDGDIIAQQGFTIAHQDTIADVLAKAERASLAILRNELPRLANDTANRIPQNHSRATTVPQRKPDDGEIDWSWPAERIRNFIRAQTKPYPGAWTEIQGKRVTIWSADII